MRRQSKLWKEELCPALAERGISIAKVDDLADEGPRRPRAGVRARRLPCPDAAGGRARGSRSRTSPGSRSASALFVRDPVTEEERFARVKVPEPIPRFLTVGKREALVALEDVIGHFLPRLFPGMEILERSMFRVTRDADFELSDEADDLLEALQHELRRRRFGDCVRVEVSASMSQAMLEELKDGLGIERRPGLPGARHARPRRRVADREARPARAEVRAVGRRLQAPVQQHRRRRSSPTSRRRTCSSTSRTTRSRRASRRSWRRRPTIPASARSRRPSTARATTRRSRPR